MLAEALGISREVLAQVMVVVKDLVKQVDWDLDVLPPDNSKRPGSEEMFNLVLSAMGDLFQGNPWAYQSKLRQMDRQIRRALVPLANLTAQPPPQAMERLALTEKAQAQVDQQLLELQQKNLTPTERVRLLKLLYQRERSRRDQALSFIAASAQTLHRSKKRRR
jgi:hypothetical protein